MLLVIDPSLQNAEAEATAAIAEQYAARGGETCVVRPSIEPEGWAAVDLDAAWDGVILMGSAASVNEPSGWRDRLLGLLGPVVSGERVLPTFGICYGHQLLGLAAGVEVGPVREDAEKLLGIRDVAIVEHTPLFEADWAHVRAAVSHREEVKALPGGWRRIATHEECAIHGMALGDRVFGLQSHPEMPDVAFARLGYDGPSDPLRLAHGRAVIDGFLGLLRQ